MSERWLVRSAAVIAVLSVLLDLTGAVFDALLHEYSTLAGSLLSITYPAVGLVILRALPRNGVGWVFVHAGGLLNAINQACDALGPYALAHGWPEPVAHVAYAATITWFPGLFAIITIGLLRFPTGTLPSRRWRWVERISLACMAIWIVGAAIVSAQVPASQMADNAAPKVTGWAVYVYDVAASTIGLIAPCVIACAASLVMRWRRSDAVQRAQIRWVVAGAVVAVLAEVSVDLLPEVGIPVGGTAQTIAESTGFGLLAVATGVAITRYKLYEIDRIVSRSVSYASVTLLLGAMYVGIVALGSTVIPHRYGSVGVALATLVVAALFVPVRRRIQQRVDRRFDRARYDAVRIVDRFAVTIRADLDQPTLTGELLETVQRAVAPAAASIWLVPPTSTTG